MFIPLNSLLSVRDKFEPLKENDDPYFFTLISIKLFGWNLNSRSLVFERSKFENYNNLKFH